MKKKHLVKLICEQNPRTDARALEGLSKKELKAVLVHEIHMQFILGVQKTLAEQKAAGVAHVPTLTEWMAGVGLPPGRQEVECAARAWSTPPEKKVEDEFLGGGTVSLDDLSDEPKPTYAEKWETEVGRDCVDLDRSLARWLGTRLIHLGKHTSTHHPDFGHEQWKKILMRYGTDLLTYADADADDMERGEAHTSAVLALAGVTGAFGTLWD